MKSMVRWDTPSGRNFHVVKGSASSSGAPGAAPFPKVPASPAADHVLASPRPCSRTTCPVKPCFRRCWVEKEIADAKVSSEAAYPAGWRAGRVIEVAAQHQQRPVVVRHCAVPIRAGRVLGGGPRRGRQPLHHLRCLQLPRLLVCLIRTHCNSYTMSACLTALQTRMQKSMHG